MNIENLKVGDWVACCCACDVGRVDTIEEAEVIRAHEAENLVHRDGPDYTWIAATWEGVVAYYADSPLEAQWLRERFPDRFTGKP